MIEVPAGLVETAAAAAEAIVAPVLEAPKFYITNREHGLESYFSEKVGRDTGSPLGGWTRDKSQATAFDSAAIAEGFRKVKLPTMTYCTITS